MTCVAFLLTGVACSLGLEPVAVLDVTVDLSADSLVPPDSIVVQVTVTNAGTGPAGIVACGIGYIVLDADSSQVGQHSWGCLAVGLASELAPGERFVVEETWRGTTPEGESLPEGDYAVVGTLGAMRSKPASVRIALR